MKRGEVRWFTFRPPDKRRPIVILTRNSAIPYLTRLVVVPVTTNIRNIPSEVLLTPQEDNVHETCVVTLDNIQTVPKEQIGPIITSLSVDRIDEIERSLCFAVGIDPKRLK